MTIFMHYDGIEGEHSLNGEAGYIKLESLSWGMSRASGAVRAGLRARTEPAVTEVTCTKVSDTSTIGLLTEGFTGKFDRMVTISFVRQGTGMLLPYLVYTLGEAGIASFQHSSAGDGVPMESFAINFTTIDIKYTAYGDDLTGVSANILYNVATGE
ncbi:type VI secretion system tube protein Hcp [Belnapia rosea]|uniref:type VI secretion system tube protein Hcp n=1 Tax=Belnapia rosea TaxID=938405 RepID=UPI0008865928|nr:type VI secretion system tube protein Hcp [Belnapia rosea]SDB68268.1 type VI secretion system secreted protein Hcp [Belnapia rosea]